MPSVLRKGTPRDYSVTLIDKSDGLEPLKQQWDTLVESCEQATIFQSFDWLYSWWRAFGDEHKLHLLLISRDKELIGLAPMMLTESSSWGIKSSTVQFIGTPEADYCDFIGNDKAVIAEIVCNHFQSNLSGWSGIDFSQIPETSPTLDCMKTALVDRSVRYRFRQIETCLSYVFEGTDEERETYSPRRNKKLRNCINFFNKKGSLSFTEIRGQKELEELMTGLFHCHITRWDQSFTPSRFLDVRQRNFQLDLIKRLAPTGNISGLLLKIDNLPIDFEFNLEFRNRVYLYTPAHNVFFNKKSPGTIMINMLSQHYVRNGCRELDYTRGGEGYKGVHTNKEIANIQILVFQRTWEYHISAWYDSLKTTLVIRRLMQNKRFMNLKYELTTMLSNLGFSGLLKSYGKKMLSKFIDFQTELLFENHSELNDQYDEEMPLEVRHLDEDLGDEIGSFLGTEMGSAEHAEITGRFKKGLDCYGAYRNQQLVSLVWSCTDFDYIAARTNERQPDSNTALIFDITTSPVIEDTTILAGLLSKVVLGLKKKGFESLIIVPALDQVTIGVVTNLGFKLLP